MYKGASRAMKHALRVDQIDPSRGFVDGESAEDYIVGNAANLDAEQCAHELRQLAAELAKAQNDLIIAKRDGSAEAVRFIGAKIAGLCARRSPFKDRLNALKSIHAHQMLGDAIRSIAPPDMQRAIFDEARRLVEEKFV